MRRLLPVLVCCITATASAAAPVRFEDCRTLDECLSALDGEAHSRPWAYVMPQDKDYAARLESFGDKAKRALLARAVGDDRAWRDLAGSILMNWNRLGPEDVPALIAALHKAPGGAPARALGRIATPRAIEAIAGDVRQHGEGNQSSGALEMLGARALPYLLPILEDEKNWRAGANIVLHLKDDALPALDGWLAIALAPNSPRELRDGALRGIAAMGSRAARAGPKLRPLQQLVHVFDMSMPLTQALLAMGDEAVLPWLGEECMPSSQHYEFAPRDCLPTLAAFEARAHPFANRILAAFTFSPNVEDRVGGASFLGFVGFTPAKTRLIELLRDDDWHVVYAAARALGWMGATEAIGALHQVATTHWLADVRQEAAAAEAALASHEGKLARPAITMGNHQQAPHVEDFGVDATNAPDVEPCRSKRWVWQGQSFGLPQKTKQEIDIPAEGSLPAGKLSGSDHGEWGGELVWQAAGGASELLDGLPIDGIEAQGGGALVVVNGGGGPWKIWAPPAPPGGPSVETFAIGNGGGGDGYVLLLERDAGGAWRWRKIAELPRSSYDFARIAPDLFAAWSGDRAVVLSPDGIKGVAECVK